MLKNAMCRNIKEYNAKFKQRKLNPDSGNVFLPYIVLIIALGLVNLAIFMGLIFFYPTYKNRSISYSSEFERAINEFTVARNWSDITAILIVSLLATTSLYLSISAFNDENM